jgi:hypothetical protein
MPSTNTPKKSSKKTAVKTSTPSDAISIPKRRKYKSNDGTWMFNKLPFVYRPKRGHKVGSNWKVPATDDYGLACHIGREYAGHYLQLLKDNSNLSDSNMLGAIVRDIDFKDASAAKGYWVGFFTHLDRILCSHARYIDVFDDVDRVNFHYAEINVRRALEAADDEAEE